MAFTATFYNIDDPPNYIYKTLGAPLGTSTCTPFEPVSNLHGSILVDYFANIDKANYAKITTGGRDLYCFVRDVVKDIGGRCSVELEIDPLKTNAAELQECDCICETTCVKDYYNTYAQNSNLKITQLTIHGTAYTTNNDSNVDTLGIDKGGFIIGTYG